MPSTIPCAPIQKNPLKVLQQIQEELTKLDLADQATLTRSLELNQIVWKNINKVISPGWTG